MNLMNKPPTGQKEEKIPPDPDYLDAVRQLPCVICGWAGGCDPHHCKDKPKYGDEKVYKRLPSMGQRSHDHDAIPLCRNCHEFFHLHRSEFKARHGVDYQFILLTRAALSGGEIDF